MALQSPLLLTCSTSCLKEPSHPLFPKNHRILHFSSKPTIPILKSSQNLKVKSHEENKSAHCSTSSDSNDNDEADHLMTNEERQELKRKIRDILDKTPVETDPAKRKLKMEKFLADYPLVVEEEDPDWQEDGNGRDFKFDQFFDKVTIKNEKKEETDDEGYDSDEEVVWQDDNYIKPIVDVTAAQWEDTVFKNFNPLVILVHHRYKRHHENEKARNELVKAVEMFWQTGLPSPRCAAIDALIEQDLVSALHVSVFPEILFTKAGKILHRDKVVRTADEWSKMMAYFYYKAVKPSCLAETSGQSHEKIPSLQ